MADAGAANGDKRTLKILNKRGLHARAAAKFRRETKVFEAGIQGGSTYLVTLDDLIGSRGGIPLVEGGKLIGAIGCSGGTGSQDEVAAKAGVAAIIK